MSIRIEIAGLSDLRKRFTNLDQQFDEAVQDAIEDEIFELEAEIKSRIQRGPASGRVYQKYNPRRTHQASAPGQAPMSDTGRLASSIYKDIDPLEATVGSKLAYAAYLEYGTRRMAPRPVWTPAAEKTRDRLPKRITENLRRVAQ